jgi:hypothetical protein
MQMGDNNKNKTKSEMFFSDYQNQLFSSHLTYFHMNNLTVVGLLGNL